MRILAIETTGLRGSIALLHDAQVLRQIVLRGQQRSAQSLFPAIVDILRQADWQPQHLQLIAVAEGPGSFTGLRIGVTTAKTLTYALGAELLGVNTLEVLAHQTPRQLTASRLVTVMDAQRHELFVGSFQRTVGDSWSWLAEPEVIPVDAWLRGLSAADAVSGPALEKLTHQLPTQVTLVPREFWEPTATAVGQLAWSKYQAGQRGDLWTLKPLYLRKSAAEERIAGNPTAP